MSGIVSKIMQYEEGEMTTREVVIFFSELVKDGIVWELQGCYQRMFRQLMELEYLDCWGEIIVDLDELV